MSWISQKRNNTWATVLLYIFAIVIVAILYSHITQAQTALTYYAQNNYSKQLDNFPDNIKLIDSYGSFVTVVTNDDTIYSGYYYNGGEAVGQKITTGIANIKSVKVFNTSDQTVSGVALRENGEVWTWGHGSTLGRSIPGSNETNDWFDNTPQRLDDLPPIKSIDLGLSNNVYALDFDGNVWGWGDNRWASLGSLGSCPNARPYCGNTGNYVTEPTPIPGLTNIESINAGGFGLVATNTDSQNLLLGTICAVEASWDKYVTPYIYTGVSSIQSANLDECSLNSLTMNGNVYSWGIAGADQTTMANAKHMNTSFGPVKKIYSDNIRTRLALAENNDLYYYEYYGGAALPPTELFIDHLENDSSGLLPHTYNDETLGETWGYITASDPEPIVNQARTIGQGRVLPNISNGDILPGLIDSQQTDKLVFNIDIRRNNSGQIRPSSSFDFTYETGTRCNNPNKAVNCHSTQLQSTVINSIDVSGTNRSQSVVRGVADITVDGVTSQKYFEVRTIDNDKLNNGLQDSLQIRVFNDVDQTDLIYVVYLTDLTNGNVRIR